MAQMNHTGAAPSQGQPGGGMNGPWPAQVQMGSQPMGAGGKWSCHFRIFIIMIFLLLLILEYLMILEDLMIFNGHVL